MGGAALGAGNQNTIMHLLAPHATNQPAVRRTFLHLSPSFFRDHHHHHHHPPPLNHQGLGQGHVGIRNEESTAFRSDVSPRLRSRVPRIPISSKIKSRRWLVLHLELLVWMIPTSWLAQRRGHEIINFHLPSVTR